MTRIAVYPGSFDPPTRGHTDLVERSLALADRVIVAVARNAVKEPLFSVEERLDMLRTAVGDHARILYDSFEGLLTDYARQRKAQVLLRGIRAVSDYEYELQMALMNRRLDNSIETVFLMPAESYSYLSSRLVKEVFLLGGSVRGLVPPLVEVALARKIKR